MAPGPFLFNLPQVFPSLSLGTSSDLFTDLLLKKYVYVFYCNIESMYFLLCVCTCACTWKWACYHSSKILSWRMSYYLIGSPNEIVFQMQIRPQILQQRWVSLLEWLTHSFHSIILLLTALTLNRALLLLLPLATPEKGDKVCFLGWWTSQGAGCWGRGRTMEFRPGSGSSPKCDFTAASSPVSLSVSLSFLR